MWIDFLTYQHEGVLDKSPIGPLYLATMGFFKRLFGNDNKMLETLLKLQEERLRTDAEIDKLRREIEFKTRQLELENIELIGEEKRKDRQHAAQLRQFRQEQAARARAAKQEKAAKSKANGAIQRVEGKVPGCVVCGDPSSAHLTAEEIKWHSAGHPGAMQ